MVNSKTTDKEKKRLLILDSARILVLERGFDSVTMDEIAEQAGLSKGTLYLYFKNKNELYLAIHNQFQEVLVTRYAEILAENSNGYTLLRRMSEEFIRLIKQPDNFMESFIRHETMLFEEIEKGNEEALQCQSYASKMFSYIVRAIQIGVSDGSLVADRDPKELAVLMWGAVNGITKVSFMNQMGKMNEVIGNQDLSLESLLTHLMDVFLKGLTPEAIADHQS